MGNVLSSSTVYANAYLTKKGRDYLFNQNNTRYLTNPSNGELIDLMKITHFTLSDPDINYNLTDGVRLETGDVPDISGGNENCIKSTAIVSEKNLISYDGELITSNSGNGNIAIEYSTDQVDDVFAININVPNQPNPLFDTGASSRGGVGVGSATFNPPSGSGGVGVGSATINPPSGVVGSGTATFNPPSGGSGTSTT